MRSIFILLLFFFMSSTPGFAKTFKLVELDEVSVDAFDIQAKRDPYFPNMQSKDWGQGANFHIKNHFFKHMFWNNRLHLSGSQTQIRHVGWEFNTGFHIIPDVADIFYYHHSQHVTEEARDDIFDNSKRQFPVEDLIGIKVYLFKK